MEFTSYDNEKIWYKIWNTDSPRAVIQIMTGLAETADYYDEFAEAMNAEGFTVALHEYRGHGHTRAAYGKGNLFRNYALDGAQLCSMMRLSNPGLPVILLAHSLGTTVSQVAIYEKLTRWDGIIYTGASHASLSREKWDNMMEATNSLIDRYGPDADNIMFYHEIFGHLNARFPAERGPFSFITTDRDKWKWIASLPYKSPPYTNRFFRDFIILQADLSVTETLEKTDPPLIDTPVLFLTGSEDVTASDGNYGNIQAQLLRDAGCKDVTSIVYPGMRHSILQERDRDKVISDAAQWLQERF